MGLKGFLLEAKWQIYRPVIWIQYGWGFLVVDLFLDLRGREEERENLQEGWKRVKSGLLEDNPHKVAGGQAEVQNVIYGVMSEAMSSD